MYNIKWENKALKQLDKIGNRDAQQEIKVAVRTLAAFPEVKHVKKLTNHQYPYRLRVGRYRVFFSNDDDVRILHIEEVKKRDDRTY